MRLDQLQLIPALRARWRHVVLTCALIVGAVLAVSLALPPRYEATATVVLEMGGADPIGGHERYRPAGTVSTYIATQVDIMKSEAVATDALRRLGLQNDANWLRRWREGTGARGDFESWIAQTLVRGLAVRPVRDANVVHLNYTSPEPHFSAAVANAIVKSYIDTTVQMQVRPAQQFNTFFEERAKPLRGALEQARARLTAYERQHGVLVSDEPDVEIERLAELSSQLVVLQDAVAEAANRRRQAAAAPGGVQEVRNDPQVVALSTDLAREEGRLAHFRTELGEQHPLVIQARESIADLRRRMDAAMQRAAGSLAAPERVAQARLAEVQSAIKRQRAVVVQQKSRRDAAAALLRDVENAQKAYDAVLHRVSQTALESANTTQPNVAVLKAATAPTASSLLLLNVSVATLLGLLLGIAMALFAELRDRRLRTIEDVTRWLQQPLLLALPDGYAQRRKAARRSVETRQRLVSVQRRLIAPR